MSYTLSLKIPKREFAVLQRKLDSRRSIKAFDRAVGSGLAKELRPLILKTPRKTGFLRKGWAAGFRRIGTLKYLVQNLTPYAIPVEGGTRPHVIRPRRGKVLAWRGKGKGGRRSKKFIFATIVNHPGTKPVLMLKRSLPGIGRAIVKAIVVTSRKIWKR